MRDETFAVVKRKPKKIQACKGYPYIHYFIFILHWFITNQHNDQLPVGLLAQLLERCTGIAQVKGSNPVQDWIFSGFLFAPAKVASITAMIFFTFKISCVIKRISTFLDTFMGAAAFKSIPQETKFGPKIWQKNEGENYSTRACWTTTVEALVSDHLGGFRKVVATKAGRLREGALVSDQVIKQ